MGELREHLENEEEVGEFRSFIRDEIGHVVGDQLRSFAEEHAGHDAPPAGDGQGDGDGDGQGDGDGGEPAPGARAGKGIFGGLLKGLGLS